MNIAGHREMQIRLKLVKLAEELDRVAATQSPLVYLSRIDDLRALTASSRSPFLCRMIEHFEKVMEDALSATTPGISAIETLLPWIEAAIDEAFSDDEMRETIISLFDDDYEPPVACAA